MSLLRGPEFKLELSSLALREGWGLVLGSGVGSPKVTAHQRQCRGRMLGRPHHDICINMDVFPKYVNLVPLDCFGGWNDVFCCPGSTTQSLLNEGHRKGRIVYSGIGNRKQMGLRALGLTLGV